GHPWPELDDAPRRLVTGGDRKTHEREAPLAIEQIAVAHPARFDGDAHLSRPQRRGGGAALVLERRVPPGLDEPDALAHFDGGRNACIFWASITFPETFSLPFMKAIVPDSLPLTICT